SERSQPETKAAQERQLPTETACCQTEDNHAASASTRPQSQPTLAPTAHCQVLERPDLKSTALRGQSAASHHREHEQADSILEAMQTTAATATKQTAEPSQSESALLSPHQALDHSEQRAREDKPNSALITAHGQTGSSVENKQPRAATESKAEAKASSTVAEQSQPSSACAQVLERFEPNSPAPLAKPAEAK